MAITTSSQLQAYANQLDIALINDNTVNDLGEIIRNKASVNNALISNWTRLLSADDLVTTYSYTNKGQSNQVVSQIAYSSASLGITANIAYTYDSTYPTVLTTEIKSLVIN